MSYTNAKGVAGQVWLITQRCHEKQFLLDCEIERRRWVYWLFQARKLYGLSVLNYVVTSNHVHLLVQDTGRFCLRASMQLINQRTGKEFNRRRSATTAVWESDFLTTAIQTQDHLARCITYIDMNMVRAEAVEHPAQWRCGGYFESLHPCRRGARLDRVSLRELLQFDSDKALQRARDNWIRQAIQKTELQRESYWTESIAVGDLAFALRMKRALAYTHPGRRAQRETGCFAVR